MKLSITNSLRIWVNFLLLLATLLLAQESFALTLSGTVYGGSNPLASATITLNDAGTSAPVGTSTTNADGVFSFTVSDGSYNMTVTPPNGSGYAVSVVNGIVVGGTNVTHNVILLQDSLTLSGTMKTSTGVPLSNAQVIIGPCGSWFACAGSGFTVLTDANGKFSASVAPGTYNILTYFDLGGLYQAGNYNGSSYALYDNIVVTADTSYDITVPLAKLSGKTTDANGVAVPNVSFSIHESNVACGAGRCYFDLRGTAASDANGDYALFLVPDSSVQIIADPGKPSAYAPTTIDGISLPADKQQNLVLSRALTLSGTMKTSTGVPLSNAQVIIGPCGSWFACAGSGFTVLTDANGKFSASVAPGTYNILTYFDLGGLYQAGNYNGSSYALYDNIVVTADTSYDITVPLAKLSGKTTDANGVAVPNVSFSIHESNVACGAGRCYFDLRGTAASDANGDYALFLVPDSSVQIIADPGKPSAYAPTTIDGISLPADKQQNLVLSRALTLSGTMKTSTGVPLSNAQVIIGPCGSWFACAGSGFTVLTDANGKFSASVAPGTYNILTYFDLGGLYQAGNYNGSSYALYDNIVVTADTSYDITVPLAKLSGKTTDANGVAVPNVSFSVHESNVACGAGRCYFDLRGTAASDANGDYALFLVPDPGANVTIIPPDNSGFAQTEIRNINASGDLLQTIILDMPDTSPPTIISGPFLTSITDSTALVQWQTNEPAQGGVRYGINNPPGTSLNETGHTTTHSQSLTGLTADTTYFVTVFGSDKAGNAATPSTVVSFRTRPVPDTTAPIIIEGPTVTAITHQGASVTWKTDEPSAGVVSYGTSSSLGRSVRDDTLSTVHSVMLSGLTAETLYHLQVSATDAVNNGPTTSPTLTFKSMAAPDVAAPVIVEGPMAVNITDTGATIVWTTDEPATTGVSWNDGIAYGVYTDDTLTTNHSVHVNALAASTTYTYVVSSKDAFANGPTLSLAKTFATSPKPDTTPPVFIDPPVVVNVTHQSAVIRWKSDEPSDALIEFGATPAFDGSEARAALVTEHNIPLTGLAAGTLYYFRVASKDAAGNGPTASATYSFTTEPQPNGKKASITLAPTVVGSTDTTATIYWETDLPADTVVTYGQGGNLTNQIADGSKVNTHQATITNMQPNASYSIVVSSTDMDGNTVLAKAGRPVTFLASSDPYGFTPAIGVLTNSFPDKTAPVIVSAPVVTRVGSTSATITWTTDEISDSQVFFGFSSSVMTRSAGEIRPVKSHSVTITNLQPGTAYYLKASSTDPTGNGPTTTGVISFTTAPLDVTPPTISAFTVPVSTASLTLNGITLKADDASGIAAYCLTDVNNAAGCTWLGTAPTSYTLKAASPPGTYTIYAFAKDTVGNVSSRATASFVWGVNGVCGSSNGQTFSSAPGTNLCTSGIATAVSGTGPWSWNCQGVNGGTPCSASLGLSMNLIFAGTGGGSVNGDISCNSGSTCPSAVFPYGTTLTLIPTPSFASTFGGWQGCTSFTGSNCSVSMNAAKTVTVTFTAAPKIKVGAKAFSTLQSAYDDTATTNGSVIKLLEGFLANPLTAGRGIVVKVEGGYNASYSAIDSDTTIAGPVKIKAGTVRMKGVKVK
jgi:hypothetical protein